MHDFGRVVRSLTFLCAFCIAPDADCQQRTRAGFRYSWNDEEEVVAVEYYGSSGLRGARLHELDHLEGVSIVYGTRLSLDDIEYLSSLKRVIDIQFGGNLGDESVVFEGGTSKLGKMKSLETVFLCKKKMKDADLKFVAELPKITYLEFIADTNPWGEDGPTVTDKSAEHLGRAESLKDLCIYGGGSFSDRFISVLTGGVQDLEHLDLGSDQLTDESLRLLATRCVKLKWLDIGSNQFTDQGVHHLANAKSLEMLWVASNSLTSKCAQSMAGLKRLRHLELTVSSIEDNDLRVLANLPKLEILALRKPVLTDKQFAMFRNHPTLESAFLNGSQLSERVVLEVIESLPKIDHLSVGSKNKALQTAINKELSRRRNSPKRIDVIADPKR